MWLTNKQLREFLYNQNTLCCLCLKISGENSCKVYDEIIMANYPEKSVELSSMIDKVFGHSLYRIDLVSDSVCQECTTSTISIFEFISESSAINKKFSVFLTNLRQSVEEASNNNSKSVKQMYLAADSKSFQTVAFIDSTKCKLKGFSEFVTRCHTWIADGNEHVAGLLPSFFHKVKCEMCDEVLDNIFELNKHEKEHERIKDENLSDEDTKFDADDQDDEIFDSSTKTNCNYCSLVMKRTLLLTHMLNDCNKLKQLYPDQYGTEKIIDIIKSENKGIFRNKKKHPVCQSCGDTFSHIYSLQRHLQRGCNTKKKERKNKEMKNTHCDAYICICDHCKKFFSKKSAIRHHIQYNCDKNVYVNKRKVRKICNYCGKLVAESTIKKHELRHLGKLVNKCSKCGKVFKTDAAYKRHMGLQNCSDKYEPTPKNFTCQICGIGFIREKLLTAHVNAMHLNAGFKCHFCQKVFALQYKLKYHMVTHTKEKNFECEICNEKFVTKFSLLYHHRRHTGEKPYKCNFCDERFLSASRRKTHERIHHMEPQLECKLCFKKFRVSSGLHAHKKRHENPRSSLYLGKVDPKRKSNPSKNYSDTELSS